VKNTARCLLCLLLACALTGCAAAKLVKRGDALMAAQRPAEAVNYYRRALEKKPRLGRDPEFVAKLQRAQCLVHYNEGQALANEGKWDEAVAAFTQSAAADPAFAQAGEALQRAKGEASKAHHRGALGLADAGKLEQAVAELGRALQFDPNNIDARAALDSAQEKPLAESQVQRLYEQAKSHEKEKRWGEAAQTLDEAVRANPNHLPSRVARWRARAAIAKAGELAAQGERLLGEKRLDQAQDEFKKALDVWPFHKEANQLLEKATAQRKLAQDRFLEAAELARQGQWDETAARAAAALDLFPYHKDATALVAKARQEAAAAHAAAGKALLAKGDLAAAEARFLRALGHVPDFPAAKEGLAHTDSTRGQAAEKAGLLGNAYLWYLQAVEHVALAEHGERLTAARKRILERVRFGLRLEVTGAGGRTTADSSALESAIRAKLATDKPEVIALAAAGAEQAEPAYGAHLELLALEIKSAVTRSEQRVHQYKVEREAPNPEIPRLRELLLVAQRDLADARREYNRPCFACGSRGRITCPTCGGTGGRTRCSACVGKGKKPCATCAGTGLKNGKRCSTCKGRRTLKCKTCGGDGQLECRTCQGHGLVRCQRCDGTGRGGTVGPSELRQFEVRVGELETQLGEEPAMIVEDVPAQWPYVVHYHAKTGMGEVSLQLTHPSSRAVVRKEAFRETSAHEDATIENANPGIRLYGDPLVLPTDEAVRQALLDKLVAAATSRLIAAAIGVKAAELKALAEGLSREGKGEEAVEALVDLARTLEAVAPQEAATIIDRLKAELRQKAAAKQ